MDSPGPSKKRRRLQRAASVDSEDLDAHVTPSNPLSKPKTTVRTVTQTAKDEAGAVQTLKAVGQFMDCGECNSKFTVVGDRLRFTNHRSVPTTSSLRLPTRKSTRPKRPLGYVSIVAMRLISIHLPRPRRRPNRRFH